ncbi:hypothetical protein RchiOBHm_Chr7g0220521 [Rosa chinensis]|uniref:Uncharacterized protein n=1 Tax=Rosa chinensis TaxID=74649 RepID=A0A2P6PCU3_ROSCH|nr:hypothetical protein RchiOBHm_Chr7g0220521 [Rosa chinensis]
MDTREKFTNLIRAPSCHIFPISFFSLLFHFLYFLLSTVFTPNPDRTEARRFCRVELEMGLKMECDLEIEIRMGLQLDAISQLLKLEICCIASSCEKLEYWLKLCISVHRVASNSKSPSFRGFKAEQQLNCQSSRV